MKRHIQVFLSPLLLAAACAATPALAQDADATAATPAPAISVTGNVAIVSQYGFAAVGMPTPSTPAAELRDTK